MECSSYFSLRKVLQKYFSFINRNTIPLKLSESFSPWKNSFLQFQSISGMGENTCVRSVMCSFKKI